jgi:hypothetical protein
LPRFDGHLLGAIARRIADRLDRSPHPAEPPTEGGVEFASFVEGELAFEISRRERAEARGAALISSSSALTTLAFAGAAIITTQDGFRPPRLTLWALIPAAICFLVAAFLGLRAGRVMKLHRVSVDTLQEWDGRAPTMWGASGADARWALTGARMGTIRSMRDGTNGKMRAAEKGGMAQVAGLLCLSVAVTAVLIHASWPDARWCFEMLQPLPTDPAKLAK